jgi:DNA-binding response OmpR family regulator
VTVTTGNAQELQRALRVLVYSDDANTRAEVLLALGKRPHPDLPPVEYVECATSPVVVATIDAGDIDLAILDGEAVPAGGMGICRQLKDEVYQCPPVLVLIGRRDDAWLATWSRAEAVVAHPIDPLILADTVIRLLRPRADVVPS